jgi:hypothetical protein
MPPFGGKSFAIQVVVRSNEGRLYSPGLVETVAPLQRSLEGVIETGQLREGDHAPDVVAYLGRYDRVDRRVVVELKPPAIGEGENHRIVEPLDALHGVPLRT